MPKTNATAQIARTFGSFSAWTKQHEFRRSQASDILNCRGHYTARHVPRPGTTSLRILVAALTDGFEEALALDGWSVADIIKASKQCQTATSTAIRLSPLAISAALQAMSFAVCELGDDYTCNVFVSPSPDAGPLAVLYMMQASPAQAKAALQFLADKYPAYDFYLENNRDVITVWHS